MSLKTTWIASTHHYAFPVPFPSLPSTGSLRPLKTHHKKNTTAKRTKPRCRNTCHPHHLPQKSTSAAAGHSNRRRPSAAAVGAAAVAILADWHWHGPAPPCAGYSDRPRAGLRDPLHHSPGLDRLAGRLPRGSDSWSPPVAGCVLRGPGAPWCRGSSRLGIMSVLRALSPFSPAETPNTSVWGNYSRNLRWAMRFCIRLLSSGSVTSLQSSFFDDDEDEWCFEEDPEELCFLELELEEECWWWCFDDEEDPDGILAVVEGGLSVSVSEPSLDSLRELCGSGWTSGVANWVCLGVICCSSTSSGPACGS